MKTGDELTLRRILETAAEHRASDLHLSVGNPPVLRIDTKLVPLSDFPELPVEFMNGILDVFLSPEQKQVLERDREIMVGYPFAHEGRFKIHLFFQRGSIAATLRYINDRVMTLQQLGLPPAVAQLTRSESGLVVVSGPFGSGRSTTLAGMITLINQTNQKYILTIERPIEHTFANDRSIIQQREVGRDTPSHMTALSTLSEEDVNVVMISDLDEPDVIRAAVDLALSGRLVLGAMDTDSSVQTVEKILSSYPSADRFMAQSRLSEGLAGVVCQRLVPRMGGGNLLVAEILLSNSAVRSVIRSGTIDQLDNVIQTSRAQGMESADHTLAQLVKTGEVKIDDALAAARDRDGLAMIAQTL
ncbi:MAG: hypothetical protein A2898_00035 [Candidatus Kerfeldbacteria bacterium RIFCSPLOWO2_01_FULL_48_11]|uniref:Bacterial type II secretion system protein E domain-containing protein n=1 Tax=Candidatus Kerfeldbacteria bacterium RIFCSPLOWO2_01_FULL_48_11 TaxID=1798543 RepID=A0A1G2B7Z6_9BACT|nr:MAG: twitching motility protein [Parcubacteria group bacterium GW2011_GWA2_48_9]KKW14472.1 MAG: twitching motility protein [Parcubacteria group bacterium GW2011_GWC2_49_9]OGY84347.1 MAG: hypothetical protein A2898_00035 [Candidatus Kerfeldbacteria bacterium RIFCSPLOWO2_01_FULL_48_11]